MFNSSLKSVNRRNLGPGEGVLIVGLSGPPPRIVITLSGC